MDALFLSPALVVEAFLNVILFVLFTIAFFATIPFLKQEYKYSTKFAYSLQKKSHLIATIVSLTLFFKIFLLPFFIYNLDKLSLFVPGAMCAAGVVSADKYGNPLVVLKILIVFLLMLYGVFYKESQRVKALYLSSTRHILYIVLYILLVAEMVLSYLYYKGIPFNETVSCCSSLYKSTNTQNFSSYFIVWIFYALYGMIVFFTLQRRRVFVAFLSVVFLYFSYESITYFFSSYIYELPSHKCPYCILQSDYDYVGYFIYSSLFLATFYSVSNALFQEKKEEKKVLFFYTFFVLLLSYYFLSYLIKNGTLLW